MGGGASGDLGPLDLGRDSGPSFKMPEPSRRERIGKRLADTVASTQSEKKRRPGVFETSTRSANIATGTVSRTASSVASSTASWNSSRSSARLAALSPAAQNLLKRTAGVRAKTPAGFILPRRDRTGERRGGSGTPSTLGGGAGSGGSGRALSTTSGGTPIVRGDTTPRP